MNFSELARTRYSCRAISSKKVERELVEQIIAAANAAPTATNAQDFKLWIVQSEQSKNKLKEACSYTFGAENFIVLGARKNGSWTRMYDGFNFSQTDAGIVGAHIVLQIADLGLATTWVGCFDAPKMHQLFPQTDGYDLVAIFPFGYPAEDAKPSPKHTKRKSISEIVQNV